MDKGIVVHQLQRAGIGQRQVPVDTAQTGKFQRQHRADTLAAGEHTVPHGIVETVIGGAAGKKGGKVVLYRRAVLLVVSFVVHGSILRSKIMLHRRVIGALGQLDHLLLGGV